ncbi:hypothetical protein HanIR_Chr04g0155181 [Helianthus annuus]|nr:hypothetical protein HanIR_Chr04g0155181 [Helianthus annuus]
MTDVKKVSKYSCECQKKTGIIYDAKKLDYTRFMSYSKYPYMNPPRSCIQLRACVSSQ